MIDLNDLQCFVCLREAQSFTFDNERGCGAVSWQMNKRGPRAAKTRRGRQVAAVD